MSTNWSPITKNSTNYTPISKNSTNFTPITKNSTSYAPKDDKLSAGTMIFENSDTYIFENGNKLALE